MQFDFQRGIYTPSFFSITVNTILDLDKIEELPVEVQATFYHEYFHFIQDLTTVFGLDCCWNSFDRIRQAVYYIQNKEEVSELPLSGEIADSIRKHKEIQDAILGSKGLDVPDNPNAYKIKSVSLRRREELGGIFSDGSVRFVELDVESEEGRSKYWFGALAIMESMTFLIQKKHFPESTAPTYPYKVASEFIEFSSEKLKGNDEFIFSLCDLSLMHPYPGFAFNELMIAIEQSDFTPITAEDIYKFAVNYFDERGYDVWEELERKRDGVLKMLDQLYGHKVFKDDKEWLKNVISYASELRGKAVYMMLDLYRDKTAFSDCWKVVLNKLGTPDVINSDSRRWISVPSSMKELEESVQPVILAAFFQLHELLLKGIKSCGLKAKCKASLMGMPIDENCDNSPWLKVGQEPICPFSGVLQAFGLNEEKIV